jgi:diaminopimelate epimerase
VRIARSAEELSLPPPSAGARVFGAVSRRAIASMVARSPWRDVAIESVEVGVGSNEATGAAAIAAALAAIERDETSHALAVGAREGVIYAFVLESSKRLEPGTTT